MEIKITSWSGLRTIWGSSFYPQWFVIKNCPLLTEMVLNSIAIMIASAKGEGDHYIFSHRSRIPYSNFVIAGEKAAFVLLEEQGSCWAEVVYVLRRNDNGDMEGRRYTSGLGSSDPQSYPSHYRYNIWEENGRAILKIQTKEHQGKGGLTEKKVVLF